ncbi:hypothetical protein HAX54_041407 [Datura stramonium]|uniref:Uncharacterized protein n=1 Tax=Datura stramonium TaxID=4076 RepID=A0ABS8SLF4_DATST|nr:hypothetical protein [Datura stramonium]
MVLGSNGKTPVTTHEPPVQHRLMPVYLDVGVCSVIQRRITDLKNHRYLPATVDQEWVQASTGNPPIRPGEMPDKMKVRFQDTSPYMRYTGVFQFKTSKMPMCCRSALTTRFPQVYGSCK